MDVIDQLPDQVNELVESFVSHPVAGDLGVFGISQYTFWMLIAVALLFVVLFVFKKKQSEQLVPHGFFVNGIEWGIEYVRDNVVKSILPDSWKRHFPFIATVFFFVLFSNVMGIIPGAKPGTGSIGVTAAVAVWSFVYFVAMGVRRRGALGYVKSLAPAGVGFPMNALVGVIEAFSTLLRPVTLAIRLFCNMFAGHVVMGTFAIITTLFFGQIAQGAVALGVGASIAGELVLLIIFAVEMLVAVIQAYVFSLLTAVYIQTAEGEE